MPDNPSESDIVLLVGVRRSGTTWLMELLGAAEEFRLQFEPFSVKFGDIAKKLSMEKKYLSKGSVVDSVEQELTRSILFGSSDNEWVNKISRHNNKNAKRLLVKEIRLNARLAWLQNNFPKIKVVYIVRDPYSVAYSSTERGWSAEVQDIYLSQPNLVKEQLSSVQLTVLQQADTLFQQNIATWCLENHLIIKNIDRDANITSLYYENLVRTPKKEANRLAAFLDAKFNKKLHWWDFLRKSKLAGRSSVIRPSSRKFGSRWKNNISDEDQLYAEKVMEVFGLDKLYSERNVPGFDQPLDLKI